ATGSGGAGTTLAEAGGGSLCGAGAAAAGAGAALLGARAAGGPGGSLHAIQEGTASPRLQASARTRGARWPASAALGERPAPALRRRRSQRGASGARGASRCGTRLACMGRFGFTRKRRLAGGHPPPPAPTVASAPRAGDDNERQPPAALSFAFR